MRTRLGTRAIVLAVALSVGLIGSTVLAAQRLGGSPPDAVSLERAIDSETMIRVADVPSGDGEGARGVFVQELDTGHLCVWDAPSSSSQARQGGCNAIDDPLAGSALFANLAYDGGPAVEKVHDARLTGLARSDAARVVVLMSDGSERSVRMQRASLRSGDFVAFGYRFKKSDLRKGIGPIAVIALDESGAEIGRQPTGIG